VYFQSIEWSFLDIVIYHTLNEGKNIEFYAIEFLEPEQDYPNLGFQISMYFLLYVFGYS